ncbi:MAG: tRNA uridine-5-carboxymethylaminomethyl(34) synthesis GTPase MnmE [Myxococcales bacterium]|nr:tRNA uridine-5-carboxymethylaminomethyl(34) synthesis GTPase MnmE [Myxococcales bacterium]
MTTGGGHAAPDTIVAIASAVGPGAVGILRLSGPGAMAAAAALVRRPAATLPDRVATLATAYDRNGAVLDQLVVLPMRGPRSFTGEDVVELQAHGGTLNLTRLLAACVDSGLRIADPGEFTRRAVEAGKLDLTRAEGLLAVIEATSERALRVAQAQLAGSLGEAVAGLERESTGVLAEIEANLDFPDEQLPTASATALRTQLQATIAACDKLLAGFAEGKALRSGITVALTGPVNAGKSSLFNALLGRTRSIVSPTAGTTRDYVEATALWQGVEVTLVDTAGLRAGADEIEQQGIDLAQAQIRNADLQLIVRDAGASLETTELAARQLLVFTKCDTVARPPTEAPAIATSSTTGMGLESLKTAILARVGLAGSSGESDPLVTTERQRQHLAGARRYLDASLTALRAEADLSICAIELRAARGEFAKLTGRDTTETLLDEIFSRFCIGK